IIFVRCVGEHTRFANIQITVRLRHIFTKEITEIRLIFPICAEFPVHILRRAVHTVIKAAYFHAGPLNTRESVKCPARHVTYETGEFIDCIKPVFGVEPADDTPARLYRYFQVQVGEYFFIPRAGGYDEFVSSERTVPG